MNNYTNEELQSFYRKDKRISFQSIFSSLCTLYQSGKYDFSQLEDMAHAINKRLHDLYPTGIQKPMQKPQKIVREDGGICPECGAEMVIKTGKKKDGKTWRGQQCPDKNCKHHREYIFLPDLKEMERAKSEDSITDEANHYESKEFGIEE